MEQRDSIQIVSEFWICFNEYVHLDLDNATKLCHGNSIWDTYSDYSECKEQCPVDPYMSGSGLNITWEDCTYQHDIADISEIIYYIGSTILCSIYNLQVSKLNWHHNKNKLYKIIYLCFL